MSLEERLNSLLDSCVEKALDVFKDQIVAVRKLTSELDERDKGTLVAALEPRELPIRSRVSGRFILEESRLFSLLCSKHHDSRTSVPFLSTVGVLMSTRDMATEMNELRERYFLHSLHGYDPYREESIPFCNVRELFDALQAINPHSQAQKHFLERFLETNFDHYGLGHRKVTLLRNLQDSQKSAIRLMDTLFDGHKTEMYGLDNVIGSIILMDNVPEEVEEYLEQRMKEMDYHTSLPAGEINQLGFMVLALLDYGEEKARQLYHRFTRGQEDVWDVVYDQAKDCVHLKELLRVLAASEYNVDEWAPFIQRLQTAKKRELADQNQHLLDCIKEGSAASGCAELSDLYELLTLEIRGYRPLRKLGRGVSGSTYLAYSEGLRKHRAVKIIDSDTVNPEEAALLASLEGKGSKHIVQVHDAGYEIVTVNGERRYVIIMDYVDGKTLQEILAEHESGLPLSTVLDYSVQLFNALMYLQDQKIFHRDLNPRNIKIDSTNTLKVLDFGIATDDKDSSPQGNRRYGGSTDLFSFGLLMYKMITGKHLIAAGESQSSTSRYADRIAELKREVSPEEMSMNRVYFDLIGSTVPEPFRDVIVHSLISTNFLAINLVGSLLRNIFVPGYTPKEEIDLPIYIGTEKIKWPE